MRCPFCDFEESKVVDSRPTEEGGAIRRRRECLSCGKRFTTYEKIERVPVMIVKKDKTREPFDKEKLLRGLLRACEKRPIPFQVLDELAADVEMVVYNSLEREITTNQIGELVMQRLKKIDDIAYVRFASVYRQFTDLNSFREELNKILGDKEN
ncbi:MAG: transcriptional repressor NrdR [Clostridia bacterium]|nr:transcriptional repressor NrdR [Clostridia bacterium]